MKVTLVVVSSAAGESVVEIEHVTGGQNHVIKVNGVNEA